MDLVLTRCRGKCRCVVCDLRRSGLRLQIGLDLVLLVEEETNFANIGLLSCTHWREGLYLYANLCLCHVRQRTSCWAENQKLVPDLPTADLRAMSMREQLICT